MLDTHLSFYRSDFDSWEEHYFIKKVEGTVTLYKSLSDGVTAVKVCNKFNRTYLFRPVDGQRLAVASMPPVFINLVEFANIKKDGTVINDYGAVFKSAEIDYLSTKIKYQPAVYGEEMTLNIRVVNKNGKLFRDKNSPKGYTFSVSMKTVAESAGIISHHIGLWKPKQLEKGCRMEVYAEGYKFCSTEIPVYGTVMYRPILVEEVNTVSFPSLPDAVFCVSPSGSPLHRRLKPSTTYQIGNRIYRMLSWEEIEM